MWASARGGSSPLIRIARRKRLTWWGEFPQIAFRDAALGRRAVLLGTRLDVWQVLETVRNHRNSVEQAADYLDLPAERVSAAVRYAAAHEDEVEEIAAREIGAAARAEELWRAEQQLLSS